MTIYINSINEMNKRYRNFKNLNFIRIIHNITVILLYLTNKPTKKKSIQKSYT